MRLWTANPVSALKALIFACLMGGLMPALPAWAVGPVAVITHASGVVTVKRGSAPSRVLTVKSELLEGDRVTTEADTYVRLKFKDGGQLVLRPNTQLVISAYAFSQDKPEEDNAALDLVKGGMRAVTGLLGQRSRDKVAIKAPTATIGIRGTNFGLLFCNNDCGDVGTVSGETPPNGLHIDVVEGRVVASNPGGSIEVDIGQFAYVRDGQTIPVLVPPKDGIRITVPPAFQNPDGSSGPGVGKDGGNQCLI
jgi:hypothetical protein